MSALDDLLPSVTSEALGSWLERPDDQRPAEGTFFEFKSQWEPRHIAKTVSAFANTQGGYLMLGVATEGNVPIGFPGLDAGTEWGLQVGQNIIGHVSPLPSWEPIVIRAPGGGDRQIVVVKVQPSRRTPHILTANGKIYARSPGGSSDPIKDRADLDRLVRRGEENERLVRDRAERSFRRFPARHAPPGVSEAGPNFQLGIVSVPIPFGTYRQAGLLTLEGSAATLRLFQPNVFLGPGAMAGLLEDGVGLVFGTLHARLFSDGVVEALWTVDSQERVAMRVLRGILRELLEAQRKLPHPVREARVFVRFGATRVQLTANEQMPYGRTARAPWEWDFEEETSLGEELPSFLDRLERRFWRAARVDAYEPS